MAVHNVIDVAAGAFLAASPWIFGFADERPDDEAGRRLQLPATDRRD
jgi:hypothetical protein